MPLFFAWAVNCPTSCSARAGEHMFPQRALILSARYAPFWAPARRIGTQLRNGGFRVGRLVNSPLFSDPPPAAPMGRSACREAVSSKETQRSALLRITSPYIGLIRYRSAMVLRRCFLLSASLSFSPPAAAPQGAPGRRCPWAKSNHAPDRARSSAERS